jgi:hydrogenase nickel incorporation protein HypA/HybF
MHELAICEALIAQVGAIAAEKAARVAKVHLGIGPLSGVEPHLLEAAYPLAAAGTAAEGSALAIKDIPVRVRCSICGKETEATANRLLCGSCGAWRTAVVAGDEMLLLRVELEVLEPVGGDSHV